MKSDKKKKILFSEKIDDAINGYALGITFMVISAFLLYRTEYFASRVVSCLVGIAFGVIGVIGCSVELSKSIKLKGTDDIFTGLVLLILWWVCWHYVTSTWLNIAMFLALVFGTYGFVTGCIKVIFSFITSIVSKTEEHSKTIDFKNIFLLLAQVLSMVLTVLNIMQIIGIIESKQVIEIIGTK